MRMVIQRVLSASVEVDGTKVSEIGQGLLVLVGLGVDDDESSFAYMIKKLLQLRIFADEQDKMNKSVVDIGGEVLLVSQFTLYGDCRKGNRPSFVKAMPPGEAKELYAAFVDACKKAYDATKVYDGVFGADMKVNLVNDGPVTILVCD